jgi:LCP family protein required for cell wall assembly
MRRVDKYTVLIAFFIFLTIAGVIAFIGVRGLQQRRPVNDGPADETSTAVTLGNTVKEGSKTYRINHDVKAVLFLGIDDGSKTSREFVADSGGRSDTIMLLVMDKSSGTTQIVSVSRDTMTDVDAYDVKGDYAYTSITHLNMQYAYGDSPMRSCYLTKKAVSRILYGIRIEGCISLAAEGIPAIVDSMGGLTFKMPVDCTDIDPRYEEGAEVTLNGKEAEALFRYRDASTVGSNEERVDRQLELAQSLFTEMRKHFSADDFEELVSLSGNNLYTDLDADTLRDLANYKLMDETLKLPGTLKEGERHDEFYLDEQALKEMVLDLFYTVQ